MKMPLYRLIRSLLIVFLASRIEAAVVISEVMFDPSGDESSDEFIELFNDSAFPAQLSGWTLTDGEGVDTLEDAGQGLIVAPRQYVLIIDPNYISDGSMTYDGLVPETALVITINNATFGSRGLSNSEDEEIGISNNVGALIDEYRFSIGNTSGHSDEKVRLSLSNDPTNWQDSELLNGTPGFRNSVTPLDRDLGILRLTSEPEFPFSSTEFRISVTIGNLGLQSLATTLLLQSDSTNSGRFVAESEYSLGSLGPGDTIVVVDTTQMPSSGFLVLRAIIETVDEDASNNELQMLVTSDEVSSGIRINEIMSTPLTGHAEWIELTVAGQNVVSTRGLSFAEGNGVYDSSARIPLPDWILSPGQFAVLSDDSTIFLEDFPLQTQVVVLSGSIGLNNNGDSIALFSPFGEALDRVDYRQSWGSGNSGNSIERVSISAVSNSQINWGPCIDSYGSTPGLLNSRSISVSARNSTLSVWPTPFTPNGDGIDEVTQIKFASDSPGGVAVIRIYDTRGRIVKRFKEYFQNGSGEVLWDGRRDNGELGSTGRYIVLLEIENLNGQVVNERTTVILARPK